MDDYDLLLLNGKILDGTGNLAYYGDIGVKDSKIVKLGILNNEKADRVIDVTGLTITPGFIDMHSHADFNLIQSPNAESLVKQGITSVVAGNCGFSLAPLKESSKATLEAAINGFNDKDDTLEIKWNTFSEYLD
ncbi:MAG: amidohydrolase family protein, partial [Candidatus Heimdallarchaeota archaeon]|nr:amidohydrolase family protein [Candidatus Heimdallarchaeota archaeon]